jgi:hypothetical protein
MSDNTNNIIYHNLYILDCPDLIQKNINFLSYIRRNQDLLKSMNVIVNVSVINQVGNLTIDDFPILTTQNKKYHGFHDIVVVYESNIREYNNYIASINDKHKDIYQVSKNITSNAKKNKPVERIKHTDDSFDERNEDSDYQLHSYIQSNLRQVSNSMDDDDASPIGDVGNKSMMDQYNFMLDRRSRGPKNPYAPRKNNDIAMMSNSIKPVNNSDGNANSMQDMMFQQLQSSNSNKQKRDTNDFHNESERDFQNDLDREDNIKSEVDDEPINIDPTKIEHDIDEDPQDQVMEQAYWNRISETK